MSELSAFRDLARELRRPATSGALDWAEAKNVDMIDLAHRHGARLKQQGPHWVGACPGGCARTDGFIVTPAKRLFYCRPSATKGDAIDMVVHMQGCTKVEALEFIVGKKDAPIARPAFRPAKESSPPRPATTTADALALFSEGGDPRATRVEQYLNVERGLDLPADLCGRVIRWHPGIGAMLVLYRNILTGEPQAVQRTFLDEDGRKTARKFIGPSGGAAAMLDPFDEVFGGLHVGEGVETCMAARRPDLRPAPLRPIWAVGSKDQIANLPVLAGIESLTLLQENDGGKSEAACEKCAQRWCAAGREVTIVIATAGKDLNDIFMDRAS
jgi:putative DNA primase/helicase